MSHGTGLGHNPYQDRDFVLATPEEFVKRFGGTKVINKVSHLIQYLDQLSIIVVSLFLHNQFVIKIVLSYCLDKIHEYYYCF